MPSAVNAVTNLQFSKRLLAVVAIHVDADAPEFGSAYRWVLLMSDLYSGWLYLLLMSDFCLGPLGESVAGPLLSATTHIDAGKNSLVFVHEIIVLKLGEVVAVVGPPVLWLNVGAGNFSDTPFAQHLRPLPAFPGYA
jgi:hypothetical protein